MRPDWKIHYLLLVAGLVVTLVSCGTEPDCATSGASDLKVRFSLLTQQPDTLDDGTVEFDTVVVADTVIFERVYALSNKDSTIWEDDTVSFLSLPLKPDAESVTFVLENRGSKSAPTALEADTITLLYQAHQRLISPDCGIAIDYVNLEVAGNHTFDSLSLIDNELNRAINVNIEIFR